MSHDLAVPGVSWSVARTLERLLWGLGRHDQRQLSHSAIKTLALGVILATFSSLNKAALVVERQCHVKSVCCAGVTHQRRFLCRFWFPTTLHLFSSPIRTLAGSLTCACMFLGPLHSCTHIIVIMMHPAHTHPGTIAFHLAGPSP